MMQAYAWVPFISLFFFLFEICTLVAAKKNAFVNRFLLMLAFLVLWSGGAFFMRLQFFDLVAPWHHISFIAVWLACISLDELLARFARKHLTITEKLLAIVMLVLLIVNVFNNWFYAPPTITNDASGNVVFTYSTYTEGTYILALIFIVITFFTGMRTVDCVRCKALTRSQALPIILGTTFMLVGQLLTLLPVFESFPIDFCMGIAFALCCFACLYNKHLFSLTLAFSFRTYGLTTFFVVFVFCLAFVDPLCSFVADLPDPVGEHSIIVVVLLFVAFSFVLFDCIRRASDNLFLKDQKSRLSGLKEYQEEVSRSLEVTNTCALYCKQVRRDVPAVRIVRVCLKQPDGSMVVNASSEPFERGSVLFESGSALCACLQEHHDVLTLSEFARSEECHLMAESDRLKLRTMNINYFVPLMDGEQLVGVATITLKKGRAVISMNNMDHLLALSAVLAIGVKNAQLYEQAAYEARTDELTHLLNRKHFLMNMEELHKKYPAKTLSLILVNLDDFKLYNQLYGEEEADDVLRRVAEVIRASLGQNDIAARLSGKEYAILLPGQETAAAKSLAESLHQKIYELNCGSGEEALKVLTCSIGISNFPLDAHNTRQLMDNAGMAVYQIKQRGKNAVMVYSTGMENKENAEIHVDHNGLFQGCADTIYALLAAIDAKDHYTFTHSNNVAYYASSLASCYGLSDEVVEIVREAALLHDVGKIGIPEAILQKPNALTSEEYEIIKKHPENAVAIIRHLPSLDYVIPAVVGHHERWDGKGYPRRLAGEDIPLMARIITVADSFDAMTTKRCYQDERDAQQALQNILEGAGTQFDPELASLFVEKFREGEIVLQKGRVEDAAEEL